MQEEHQSPLDLEANWKLPHKRKERVGIVGWLTGPLWGFPCEKLLSSSLDTSVLTCWKIWMRGRTTWYPNSAHRIFVYCHCCTTIRELEISLSISVLDYRSEKEFFSPVYIQCRNLFWFEQMEFNCLQICGIDCSDGIIGESTYRCHSGV